MLSKLSFHAYIITATSKLIKLLRSLSEKRIEGRKGTRVQFVVTLFRTALGTDLKCLSWLSQVGF